MNRTAICPLLCLLLACSSVERKELGRVAIVAGAGAAGAVAGPVAAGAAAGSAAAIVKMWGAQDQQDRSDEQLQQMIRQLLEASSKETKEQVLRQMAARTDSLLDQALRWVGGIVLAWAIVRGVLWWRSQRKEHQRDAVLVSLGEQVQALEVRLQRDLDGDGKVGT